MEFRLEALKSIGTVAPVRVAGFGLDRFVSVLLLGVVPLRLDTMASRTPLMWASLASVAIAAAALLLAGSVGKTAWRGDMLSPARFLGPRTLRGFLPLGVLGFATAVAAAACLWCVGQVDAPLGFYLPSLLVLGIGSALLVFLWGTVFSRVGARTTLVEASLGYLTAFVLVIPYHALPFVGQVVLVVAAVLLDAALLFRANKAERAEAADAVTGAPGAEPDAVHGRAWTRRICTGLFLYGIAMAFFGQVQVARSNVALSVSGSALQALIALAACVLTLVSVLRFRGRSEAVAYRVAFVVTMLGCLLPLSFPSNGSSSMVFMLAGETTMLVVVSSVLFESAHHAPRHAARVLSLGIASKALGDVSTRASIEFARGLGLTMDVGGWTFLFAACIILEYAFVLTESDVQTISCGSLVPVAKGGRIPCQTTANPLARIVEEMSERYDLTERESEVLGYLLQGRSSRRIQEELFISESTANTHIRHIYRKLGVHSKQELLDVLDAPFATSPITPPAPPDSPSPTLS